MAHIFKIVTVYILGFMYSVNGESKLMSIMIENLMDCMAQAPENFSLDVCQEMLRDGNDNSLVKYDSCKCLGACTSKKLGIMDANGIGVKSKVEEYIAQLDNEVWRNEAIKILKKCADTPGKNCDLSYNFMVCTMENSSLVRDFVKAMTSGDKSKEEN
uniref:Odorant-binding protein n=1 Tax=Phenacoccus solenopsis TaxID=483260 RepID=A0A0U2VBR9_9HEMI|nr:odorant-binding protein [Phenacoccus solenopsis]